MTKATTAAGHWAALDGLRGVLCLCVVALHFGLRAWAERHGLWPLRLEFAVDVFFLLSGFVLTHATRNGVAPLRFAWARAVRLLPVFWVTTAVVLAAIPHWPAGEALDLVAAAPLVGNGPVNFPAWSVTWELVLPVLAVAQPWRLPPRAVLPVLVAALVILGIADIDVARGEDGVLLRLIRAAAGLTAGHALYRSGLADTRVAQVPFTLAALMVVTAIVGLGAVPLAAPTLPWLAALAIVAGTKSGTGGGGLFASAPLRGLGAISYTLYLAHVPVLRVMQAAWGGMIDQNPLAKLLGIAASLALAVLLTLTLERPLMRRLRGGNRA